MPTLLTRTFALLNNTKPPTEEEQVTVDTVSTPSSPKCKPDISIWKAAEQGDLSALKYYVQHSSVDPATLLNTRDPDTDCTLLHLVVSNNTINTLPIIELLLKHGADATARNIYNVQAIHMASLHSPQPLELVTLLLSYSAKPNARDGDGWTPLHYAARFCQPPDKILQLLVSKGADINLTDTGHKSPLFGLLANGDLSTCLDWLIHTAKADVSIRGDFLDQNSRKTRPGTIILQAAKYSRINCLSLLMASTVAMNQLRRVIHRDELNYANQLVKEQRQKLINPAANESQKLESILSLLQELEDTLERDPLSLLNTRKLESTNNSPLEPKENNKIRRRHTFMVMIDSMRKKRSPFTNTSVQRKGSATSKIFRRMSRIIRRTKSESYATTTDQNENKSTELGR